MTIFANETDKPNRLRTVECSPMLGSDERRTDYGLSVLDTIAPAPERIHGQVTVMIVNTFTSGRWEREAHHHSSAVRTHSGVGLLRLHQPFVREPLLRICLGR